MHDFTKVVVVDMQPITPAVGGGRLRLLGLYHNLGKEFSTTYVGTYDWRGPKPRHNKLTPSLQEILLPLSDQHFTLSEWWKVLAGGRNVIDITFDWMTFSSPRYCNEVRRRAQNADVVIFSHPWAYPVARDVLDDKRQLIIYDSHNVEGFLRTELYEDDYVGTEIAKHVVSLEYELVHRADRVLACSAEDARLFEHVYEIDASRINVIPNGVFIDEIKPASESRSEQAKSSLEVEGNATIFVGSAYGPNVEGACFIIDKLAPAVPELTFLLCGSVTESDDIQRRKSHLPANVRLVGPFAQQDKDMLLAASDSAINPMFSGSGTNIKMFDYLAAGLPVVTTAVGARGIQAGEREEFIIASSEGFPQALREITSDPVRARMIGQYARQRAEKDFAWERISPELGVLLHSDLHARQTPATAHTPMVHSGDTGAEELNPKTIQLDKTQSIAFLSTWNTRCGIAEYSRHLCDALRKEKLNTGLISLDQETGLTVIDTSRFTGSMAVSELQLIEELSPAAIARTCSRAAYMKLSIQYHPVFFSVQKLADIVEACHGAGIAVTITLHNSREIKPVYLARLCDLGATLIVHSTDEHRSLQSAGCTCIEHIPHGILEIDDEDEQLARHRHGITGSPVVATFGFLRPHKGLLELIEAYANLRLLHPNLSLLALTALYPSPDSGQYLTKCKDKLSRLGLDHDPHVVIRTDFLEADEVVSILHAASVIALPYYPSDEGASGSLHIALASQRPVLTTMAKVFSETSESTYKILAPQPAVLATGLANILSSPVISSGLRYRTRRYVRMNGWSKIAHHMIRTIGESSSNACVSNKVSGVL